MGMIHSAFVKLKLDSCLSPRQVRADRSVRDHNTRRDTVMTQESEGMRTVTRDELVSKQQWRVAYSTDMFHVQVVRTLFLLCVYHSLYTLTN
jgi:hypothetical protein